MPPLRIGWRSGSTKPFSPLGFLRKVAYPVFSLLKRVCSLWGVFFCGGEITMNDKCFLYYCKTLPVVVTFLCFAWIIGMINFKRLLGLERLTKVRCPIPLLFSFRWHTHTHISGSLELFLLELSAVEFSTEDVLFYTSHTSPFIYLVIPHIFRVLFFYLKIKGTYYLHIYRTLVYIFIILPTTILMDLLLCGCPSVSLSISALSTAMLHSFNKKILYAYPHPFSLVSLWE